MRIKCSHPGCTNQATKHRGTAVLCDVHYGKSAECQEPECSQKATKQWNGRNVCEDHYDKFSDEHDSHTADLH
ncbi:hypothetical protein J4401_04580 [Candidatus Woesearchaeota archaeon]|nr:hypothetical protein [Candidatus Woesearchaeota archaeon]